VAYAWLVAPLTRELLAYRLEAGQWRLVTEASGYEVVRAAPFVELALALGNLGV